jgi:oligosaccharide repeat unit polymerase
MGKMNFMILFLATAIILTERKIIRLWHLVLAFGILLVFFVGIQKMRGSYTNPRHFTALYLTTSLANLDQNVKPKTAEHPAENSFRLFYAIRSSIDDGKTDVVDPILDFKWVKIGNLKYYSNTYTTIYPFYKDFGLVGVIIFALLLGWIFGYLFKTAEDGSQFSFVLYAILAGTVVMQFIGDTFFMVLSQNIQYLIAALIPYIISKYKLFANTFKRNG